MTDPSYLVANIPTMHTIIVPTDFSETSKNAAKYAVQLASGMEDTKVVLYNVFDRIAAGTDGTPLHLDNQARKQIMEVALNNLALDLVAVAGVPIECVAEEGTNIIESIDHFARHHGAELVIIGITGASRMEQILMGSNAINLVHNSTIPVLIVPPGATYQSIQQIALLCDMKEVEKTIPEEGLRRVLAYFKPSVHVLQVNAFLNEAETPEYKAEKNAMDKLLQGAPITYAHAQEASFMAAVHQYCQSQKIDMLITFPRKHGFLSRFFTTSHTEKLAHHSTVPVIALAD